MTYNIVILKFENDIYLLYIKNWQHENISKNNSECYNIRYKNNMLLKINDMKIKIFYNNIWIIKEISADEYEKLIQNKKDIFNNTFKNTNELVEDKKQILKTDPDAIIKKQQKDDYIEKLSDLISQKINNTDDLKKNSDKIDFKKLQIKLI